MHNFIKKRFINTVKYSLAGLKAACKTEQSFKLELFLSLVGLIFIIFSQTSKIEKLFLINSILLVLLTELLNTAIEKTIDKISKEIHYTSKVIKDLSSAAVFITVINLIITWSIIFA